MTSTVINAIAKSGMVERDHRSEGKSAQLFIIFYGCITWKRIAGRFQSKGNQIYCNQYLNTLSRKI